MSDIDYKHVGNTIAAAFKTWICEKHIEDSTEQLILFRYEKGSWCVEVAIHHHRFVDIGYFNDKTIANGQDLIWKSFTGWSDSAVQYLESVASQIV
jgi:hypothetical protein